MASNENILGLPVVKRDGPWAEVDANGVTVGLNGREPEGAQAGGGPVLTFRPEGSLEEAVEVLCAIVLLIVVWCVINKV